MSEAVVHRPAEPMPATASSEAGVSQRAGWRGLLVVAVALVVVDAAWFAAIAWMLDWFYRAQLPHYDSVGSFIGMFLQMHETARQGLAVSFATARQNPLSWFYSMYAALAGLVLPVTPVTVVSVHLPALLIAQAALVAAVRAATRSWAVAFVAGLLPFVPATMAGWDGGYQDPRRDPALFLLLVATFFTGVLYASRPWSWGAGLAFGVCGGLSIWARGNALPYVGLVMLPLGVAALVRWQRSGARRGGIVGLMMLALRPAIPFLLLTGLFYAATLEMILDKYIVGAYGVGYDRLDSLARFGMLPFTLTFDANSTLTTGIAVLALAVATALGGLAFRPLRVLSFEPAVMVLAGLFVAPSVMLFNTLLVGVSPLAGRFPFFPALVGTLGVLAGLLCTLGPAARGLTPMRAAAVGVACLVATGSIVGGFLDRAWKGANVEVLPYAAGDGVVSAERVATVRSIALRLSCVAGGRQMAFFWIGEVDRGLSTFYLAQEGGRSSRTSRRRR